MAFTALKSVCVFAFEAHDLQPVRECTIKCCAGTALELMIAFLKNDMVLNVTGFTLLSLKGWKEL